ncbi:MAG: tetratricopeptide repeat protein [Thiobacillus sp.]
MPLARFLAVLSLMLASASVFATEVQDINQQFRQGDLNGALQRANTYLAKNPKDAQVRFLKGLILADQNKSAEAIQVFTGLTEDFPELPEPYNNLAVLYAAQNKFDEAKNALEMAIRSHPNYTTAHENLGDIYAKLASLSYDKALQLDQNNPSARAKLALLKDIVSPSSRPQARTPVAVQSAAPAAPKPSVAPVPAVTAATPSAVAPATVITTSVAPEQTLAGAEATVIAWARAWAAQDADGHLAFYTGDFEPPAKLPRAEWEAQRRERIMLPERISVKLTDIQSREVNPSRVNVSFKQSYQSDRLKVTSNKVMELVWRIGKWLIIEEKTQP